MMMYQTITMKQLEQMLDCHEDIFLLDVRNRASYEMCHMEGAVRSWTRKWNLFRRTKPLYATAPEADKACLPATI